MRRATLALVALAGALSLAAVPAPAADLGIRGGIYSFKNGPDEPFAGVELLFDAADRFYFNPNAEYVFVDNGKFWTFNFDAHYDLPVSRGPYFWLGGGLAVLWSDPDGPASSTKAHANLLAGIGFRTRGHAVPYIQVKLITTDPTTIVAAGGIRF